MSKALIVGLVVVVVIGAGAAVYIMSREKPMPEIPPLPATPPLNPHGGAPGADPHGGAPGGSPHGGAMHGGDGHETTFAKVHFMRKFVAALTEPPKNLMPAPDYAPLIKQGAAPVQCTDCHTDTSLDFEAMIANDPGDEAVEPLRMQRRRFMIPLMEKWVGRLNRKFADRLTKEVTCTDCHDLDPRDEEARSRIFPPLMIRFVRALKEPPANENPAKGWKPLLKDPSAESMLCATCHGTVGASMEQNILSLDGPPPPEAQENLTFMVNLMERWVRELNKKAKEQLVKAVTCTDCHEVDPRK